MSVSQWRPLSTAPQSEPLEDFGPNIRLLVDGEDVLGHWCAGLEVGEIWIPPGWLGDDGEPVTPTHWRPIAEGKAPLAEPGPTSARKEP